MLHREVGGGTLSPDLLHVADEAVAMAYKVL